MDPKNIVEIGSYTGATIFVHQCLQAERFVTRPGGSFGGGYPFWKIPHKRLATRVLYS